ncbi:MAG: hypothetical protein ACI4JQ_06655 [Ruminococcus sp.]
MIQLTAQGKFINTSQIERLFTQGEKFADRIYILVDTVNNDVDISDCTFVMRTVASNGSMTETLLQKQVQEKQLLLTWNVSEEVTAVPGMLHLELMGSHETLTIIKYQMPSVFVKETVMGAGLPVPDVVDEKLARMNEILQEVIVLAGQISDVDNTIQEVMDAREGRIVANTFSSLQKSLAADFEACITQGELESAISSAVATLTEKDVGQFWKNELGEIRGEIFNCYLSSGIANTASGLHSHAEGVKTTASGSTSHAEGDLTTASGFASHAEGSNSTASGRYSHAEGGGTTASGECAHAGGLATRASGACQFAIGKWNRLKGDQYAFIIGNGSQSAYSDALEMDWDGNLWTAGDITATDADGSTVSLCGTQEQLIQQQSAIGMNRKNLLKNTAGTVTQNGITFTLNADGSVTCSGTATADTNYRYIVDLQQNTSYILSGCPEGGSTSTYQLFAMDADTWSSIQRDIGSGKTFDSGTHTTWHIIIRITSGQTVDGLTFYPMLRYGFITDDAYQPYTDDLQTQIDTLRAAIISLGGNV